MSRSLRSWLPLIVVLTALSVGFTPPEYDGITHPISMSLSGDRLFVSDISSGVHVYDVSDPTTPVREVRIPLRGNRGTAAKDDILYADDWGSLQVIRVRGESYKIVKTIPAQQNRYPEFGFGPPRNAGYNCGCSRQPTAYNAAAPAGGGSSFTTFAIIDNYLYFLHQRALVTMDITRADDPVELSRKYIDWTVETLYPTDEFLFVGGTNGMFIFDRSDPAHPRQIGRIDHFRACDPVVVSGSVAYVTLRGGSGCGGNQNVLLCVDITDPTAPKILAEKSMRTPYGLTVDTPLLYVSTGYNGYELLDVTVPTTPSRIKKWEEKPTKDFIWSEDLLYVLTFKGLLIFDVSTPEEPVLLSEVGSGSES